MLKISLSDGVLNKEYEFEGTEVLLGKTVSGPNTLTIDDPAVADMHCKLFQKEDGAWVIVDIKTLQESPLASGESFSIGATTITANYTFESPPSEEELDALLNDILGAEEEKSGAVSSEPLADLPLEVSQSELEALLGEPSQTSASLLTPPKNAQNDISDSELSEMLALIEGVDQSKEQGSDDLANLDIDSLLKEAEEVATSDIAKVGLDEQAAQGEKAKEDFVFADEEEVRPLLDEKAEEEDDDDTDVLATEYAETDEKAVSLSSQDDASLIPVEGEPIYDEKKPFEYLSENPREPESTLVVKLKEHGMSLIAALMVISLILSIGTYFYVSDQNIEQERIAARRLADISMAFAHATIQGNGTAEHAKLRLSLEEFVDEHLKTVLPRLQRLDPVISNDGLFGTPYDIEVITSSDLEQYVLLAHPRGGLIQTLLPKSPFFIDSHTMTIRKLTRGEQWQALLGDRNSLDGVSSFDLINLARTEEVVVLHFLEGPIPQLGFATPSALTDASRAAVNFVYNAPRYYMFAQALLQKASQLGLGVGEAADLSALRHNLTRFTRFSDLVLYSPSGLQFAIQAHLGFATYPPGVDLHLGYINFAEGSEDIQSAELLTESVIAANIGNLKPPQAIETGISEKDAAAVAQSSQSETPKSALESIDKAQEPVYIKLLAAKESRKKTLEVISKELSELLEKNDNQEKTEFLQTYNVLERRYQETMLHERKKLSQIIGDVYKAHVENRDDFALELFDETIKELELSDYLGQHIVKTLGRRQHANALANLDLDDLFGKINHAKDLDELSSTVEKIKLLIDTDAKMDPTKEVRARNHLRSSVLAKIGEFVLSPKETFQPELLQERNRKLLDQILQHADVTEQAEREFYLKEFDSLMQRFHSVLNTSDLEALKIAKENLTTYVDLDKDLNPSEKKDLEDQLGQSIAEIDHKKALVEELKATIAKIPVNTGYAEERGATDSNLGRIGQQILIQETLERPSPTRDQQLTKAISLLEKATADNRTLWGDILEARKLIAQTSESEITSLFSGDLGFTPTDKALPLAIRESLQRYVAAKRQLAAIKDEEQYRAQFDLFEETQIPVLHGVISNAQKIHERLTRLKTASDEYAARLKVMLADYRRAEVEGFFSNANRYHSVMLSRLKQKVEQATHFVEKAQDMAQHLDTATSAAEEIAMIGLREIDARKRITSDSLNQLQQRTNAIAFPDLLRNGLADRFNDLKDIQIAPTPPKNI